MNSTPFRLTFGVELEFLVRYDPEEYRDQMPAANGNLLPERSFGPYQMLVRRRMIRILNANGFSTHNSINTYTSEWTVTTDATISNNGCKSCCGVELKSPALEYSPSALKQIMNVVELLVSEFDLFVNESCGLHVHVGDETRGFDMGTLKNFASLITVFEKQLNSLHPFQRRQNGYAKPVCSAFREDASPRKKLLIIDKLESVDDVIRRFHPGPISNDRYMAFNFINLQENKPFKTIEFRQHQGTLDPNQIANWAKVACNLVQMSYANGEGIQVVINRHRNDTNYTVMDLLVDLNLSDLASFYAPLVLQYGGEDPSSYHAKGQYDESPVAQGIRSSAAFQSSTSRVFRFQTAKETGAISADTAGFWNMGT